MISSSFYLGAGVYFLENISSWQFPDGLSLGNVQGVAVTVGDLTAIASILFAFQHAAKIRTTFTYQWGVFLTFAFLVAFSIFRGAIEFGLSASVNEARYVIYFLGCIAWYSTISALPDFVSLVKWRNFLVVGSLGVMALQVFNFLRYGIGNSTEQILIDDVTSHNSRTLVAVQASFILFTLTFLIVTRNYEGLTNQRFRLALPIALVLSLLVAQQRSVWVAAIVTLGAFAFTKNTRRLTLIFTFASVTLLALVAAVGSIFGPIGKALQESGTNSVTFFARSGSWAEYIANYANENFFDQVVGLPFGSGWGRYDGYNHLWVEFNPHNWYIIVLLRTGILGLASLVFCYLIGLVRAFAQGRDSNAFGFIQLQQLAYQFFYPAPWQVPLPVTTQSRDVPTGIKESSTHKSTEVT